MKALEVRKELSEARSILGARAVVVMGTCYLDGPRKDGRILCTGVGAHRQPCAGKRPLWKVGTWELGAFLSVKGLGATWRRAIARARWRKHVSICRKRWVRQLCRHCDILGRDLEEASQSE